MFANDYQALFIDTIRREIRRVSSTEAQSSLVGVPVMEEGVFVQHRAAETPQCLSFMCAQSHQQDAGAFL